MGIEVLTSLDKAKTQWYHFTAIIVAGMGFFTDAYDLFCISTVSKLLGRIYYYDPATGKPGTLPATVAAVVNGIALCGALVGQLFFGWLGDKLGRKKVYGLTLMCMVISSIASGLSFGHSAKSVMATLCFFRFWLGFGIGGDYPLSATIMSEYANTRTRGAFIAAVFAMQGFGILAGGVVSLVMSAGFKAAYPAPTFAQDPVRSTPPQADYMWRIIFMLGAVPALLTYYWRMKMPETARYTALVQGNVDRATEDMNKVLGKSKSKPASGTTEQAVDGRSQQVVKGTAKPVQDVKYGLFSREFVRKHGLQLLGTTTTWFLLDVAYYSQNLFQKDVFTAVGWLKDPKTMSAIDEVYKIARAQTLIALCSTVPGYWFTVLLIDRIGRFAIQLGGFFFMSVFMLALSIPYYKLRGQKCDEGFCGGHHMTFIVFYSLTFFFSNFGPNSTTFIVPAELFPARLRSTCHGISAAAGKAGSIVGAFGFLYAAQSPHKKDTEPGYRPGIGIRATLILLGVCNCLGMVFTFLVPETRGKSLEELSGENEEHGNGGSDSNRVANTGQLEV